MIEHHSAQTLTIIVACSPDGIIGQAGALPWHLPSDLKRFRSLTWGKPILMGRRTHESIGRPLPGRLNIVITRKPGYRSEGVVVAHSPEQALAIASADPSEEVMVIGGAEIYRQFLPISSKIHLTIVEGDFPGDTTFPIDAIGPPDWVRQFDEHHPADSRNRFSHRHLIFLRQADGKTVR
ncbi:N/A [soil metagenome]